jgi:alanine dehydrogenase
VTDAMVRGIREGSVIVDCAIDQGGCVEGIRETSHAEPVYERHGVLHYAVGNIPGAVPHTSTYALTNATLPYVVALATRGVADAIRDEPELGPGVNTANGFVTNQAVATALGSQVVAPSAALA